MKLRNKYPFGSVTFVVYLSRLLARLQAVVPPGVAGASYKGVKLLLAPFVLFSAGLSAQEMEQAKDLYQHTRYEAALRVLSGIPMPGAEADALMGKCNLMRGDFTHAIKEFEKAVALEPNNAQYALWLARSWAKRAESANPLSAPGAAVHAREFFEKALALDPNNTDALSDQFAYYLNAPGFLGGGLDKAEAIARRVETLDPPEGHFLLGELARKQKRIEQAEAELRTSVKLQPSAVGHAIALARLLAQEGRMEESEATLAQAEKASPNNPRLLFGRASIYVETHRNPQEARALLERYLAASITPDDPPRQAAEKLLKKVTGA